MGAFTGTGWNIGICGWGKPEGFYSYITTGVENFLTFLIGILSALDTCIRIKKLFTEI